MSPRELAWRARQSIGARATRWLPHRAAPAANRDRICLEAWDAPLLDAAQVADYVRAADRILAGEVDVFGEWVALGRFPDRWHVDPASSVISPLTYGLAIDYRDPALVGSARNVWEVNRHFQLVTLAQAWSLTAERRYREGALSVLDSWLRAAPWPLGLNWISALEHGIRLINWYAMGRMLKIGSNPVDTSEAWLRSIYRHCEFIWAHQSRHSSANNHLIGEMAGLYVATCAWPCWDRSTQWHAVSKRILEREAAIQVHPDGVLREQTVGYQIFVIQFLIIAGLAGERTGDPFSREYWSQVQRMMVFLRSIADCAGNLPDFGDSDQGMAYRLATQARGRPLQDLLEVESTLFGSGAARGTGPDPLPNHSQRPPSSAMWLQSGFQPPRNRPTTAAPARRSFPDGGYFILGRGAGTASEVSLVFDAGPLGYLSLAAHGHADCLSFTLSLAGERFLTDTGTYCYHASALWRDYFRGTAAHNTVRIDGVDQSLIGGPFMWMRKAEAHVELVDVEAPIQRIRASHDGYRHLPSPLEHTRELIFDTSTNSVEVRDELKCTAAHTVERFWHFAEHCDVRQLDSRTVEASGTHARLQLRCHEECTIQILRGSTSPRAGWISPGFGSLRETSTVIITSTLQSSDCLVTSVSWTLDAPP